VCQSFYNSTTCTLFTTYSCEHSLSWVIFVTMRFYYRPHITSSPWALQVFFEWEFWNGDRSVTHSRAGLARTLQHFTSKLKRWKFACLIMRQKHLPSLSKLCLLCCYGLFHALVNYTLLLSLLPHCLPPFCSCTTPLAERIDNSRHNGSEMQFGLGVFPHVLYVWGSFCQKIDLPPSGKSQPNINIYINVE